MTVQLKPLTRKNRLKWQNLALRAKEQWVEDQRDPLVSEYRAILAEPSSQPKRSKRAQ